MLRAILRNAGINLPRLRSAFRGWRRYVRDRAQFQGMDRSSVFAWGKELPILTEWDESSGSLGAYFFQDQLVARWIYDAAPFRHVDVGSRIDGFIGSLSIFREVEVIDIRPQHEVVHQVTFHQLDLMAHLPSKWLEATDSLSCLHTIEHFGLGRYGDILDPDGYLKGIEQLQKMVAPGGIFYLSTPIGPQRIEFNAHRIFGVETMLSWFADGWKIERFAVIDDANVVHESIDLKAADLANHLGCRAGVGILAARRVR